MKHSPLSKINIKFGKRIQIERIKRNISQDELADFANISRGSISNIERGINSPTLETIEKIAKAFDMDILEILNFSNISL